jgi:hypothetical protein
VNTQTAPSGSVTGCLTPTCFSLGIVCRFETASKIRSRSAGVAQPVRASSELVGRLSWDYSLISESSVSADKMRVCTTSSSWRLVPAELRMLDLGEGTVSVSLNPTVTRRVCSSENAWVRAQPTGTAIATEGAACQGLVSPELAAAPVSSRAVQNEQKTGGPR